MKLSPEQIAEIPHMRNELKMTDKEIADSFSCARNTVTYWVKRLREEGYEIKRYGRGGRPKTDIKNITKQHEEN